MTSNPSDTHVEFVDVYKRYGVSEPVVKKLNLAVQRGEFLTFLGPSGSGKTTTLLMLAGFEGVTSGNIFMDGREVQDKPPAKRNIGMVFQNYALFPHMSVAENIAFPLRVRRLPKAEVDEKVARVMERVRLPGLADRRPSQISGGQQQRVALARALVFEPNLVLMDEPLGALDKRLRDQMQFEIKRLHREFGVTIVYVTHDQSEAMTMSDRIVVFNEGTVQQVGSPEEIYERPQTSFVAQFVGENNQIRGKVLSTDSDTCVVEIAGGTPIRARAINAKKGGQTLLSVRPENILLGVQGGPGAENSVNAVVQEITYLGDQVRVRALIAGEAEITVRLSDRTQWTQVGAGGEVTLSWSGDNCVALDIPN